MGAHASQNQNPMDHIKHVGAEVEQKYHLMCFVNREQRFLVYQLSLVDHSISLQYDKQLPPPPRPPEISGT